LPGIKILIVDDHELIRRYIAGILATTCDFDVVGQAGDGMEAVRRAEQCQPDVVLLDIGLPGLNGLQAVPLIKRVSPRAEILMVTSHDHPFFMKEAFDAGARGFLAKDDVSNELVAAVGDVHSRKRFVSRRLRDESDLHAMHPPAAD
jgi:DNA-binding NarL/FixJ family response regulator